MKRRSILIVEDDELSSLLLKTSLEKNGYTVLASARSGEKAVSLAGKLNPDLVAMDINLSGKMDGLEASAEIKKRFNIPSVFLTSYVDKEIIEKAVATSALGFLSKPVDDRNLEATFMLAFSRLDLEKKSSENWTRYRNIFEDSNEAIYLLDSRGKFIDANRATLDLLNYTGREIVELEFTTILTEPEKSKEFFDCLENSGSVKEFEAYLRKKSGDIICCSLTASAIQSDESLGKIYQGIIRDLSEKQKRIHQLNNTIEGIIKALILTVEARDPYTAGHQVRVSRISTAIAGAMGIPDEKIEAIKIASKLHDLGKVFIPSEILSKPYGISDIEFQMIKTHPRVSYDILKTIDFSWPVADIVLQHHEKMDGSGYPKGLAGEDILLESRIISVADVVEAMASDRPYRAAIGLDAAIDEINRGKGILYDPDVVDSCISSLENDSSILGSTIHEELGHPGSTDYRY
jgi:PAS domain S-box-containing protein